MVFKKIKSIFKIIKDFYIGIYIRSKNRKDKFRIIYKHSYWKSSNSNSFSGAGSENEATMNIRKELELFIKKENVKSIIDIPCGDFFWMSKLNLENITYTGADIVDDLIYENNKKHKLDINDKLNFVKLDIIKDNIGEYDLIINRDCLVHFTDDEIFRSLKNIKNSKCKYFGSTIFLNNYNNKKSNLPDNWRPINLCKEPFNLPDPYIVLNDRTTGKFDQHKAFAIWNIKKL